MRKRKRRFSLIFVCILILSFAVYFVYGNQRKIIEVPYISQQGVLPTGCELVSSAMVLNYYECDVTVNKLADQVPKSEITEKGGKLYGVHPNEKFVGNPYSSNGFGCYAPVVTSLMNSFLNNKGKTAVDVTGTALNTLTHTYIKNDIPVIIWATMNMKQPYYGKCWTVKSTGKPFQWIAREHCLVLVGYDKYNYYFNDPYRSNGRICFEKGLVENRFQTLGKQAVVVV